jgi:hypothetical protein
MKYVITTDNSMHRYHETGQEKEALLEYIKTLMHLGIPFSVRYEHTWQELMQPTPKTTTE